MQPLACGSPDVHFPVCRWPSGVQPGLSCCLSLASRGVVCLARVLRPFLTCFCTLHLSPSFVSPPFPSVRTASHCVVLGDTYNIPLDPRGKQQGSAAPSFPSEAP